jgi:hypothetical protein
MWHCNDCLMQMGVPIGDDDNCEVEIDAAS